MDTQHDPATAATPRRRLARRPLIMGLSSILVGFGLIVGSVVTAQPAQAGPFGWCDPDTTFTAPASSTANLDGINVGSIDTPSLGGAGFTYVNTDVTQRAPLTQYDGAGLGWHTFAKSCGDFNDKALSTISNIIFEGLALWPMRILGILLDLSFSTVITNWLFGLSGGLVTAMSTNIFGTLAPVFIMVILFGAIIKIARGKTQQGWGSVAWLGIVAAATGLLFTPAGVGWLQSANDKVAEVTQCAIFSTTGVGCSTGSLDTTASYSNGMVESLAFGTWAVGEVGDMVSTPAPTSITLTPRDSDPKISDAVTVTIPTGAIPAKTPGAPTYAEVIRWTQTYTAAELVAMQADQSLRCDEHPLGSPKIDEITDMTSDAWSNGSTKELCSYKWLVRSAIVDDLLTQHSSTYTVFSGTGLSQLTASFAAIGLLPLAIGIGIMGFMVLLLQLELLTLFIAGPIVALAALKSPKIARTWGENMAATAVKRVTVGLGLGVTVWMAGAINESFSGSSGAAVMVISPVLIPLTTAVMTIGAMVAGFMLLTKIQKTVMSGSGLEAGDQKAGGGAAKKVGTLALAATAGAVGAGSGMHLAGAGKAMLRSLSYGGGNRSPMSAIALGVRSGKTLRHEHDVDEKLDRAIEPDEVENAESAESSATASATASASTAPATEATAAAVEGATRRAWQDVVSTPAFQAAIDPARRAAAMTRHNEANAAYSALIDSRQVGEQMAESFAQATHDRMISEGATPPEAQAAYTKQMNDTLEQIDRNQTEALAETRSAAEELLAVERGVGNEFAQAINEAMAKGGDADAVGTRFGLDDTSITALRQYQDALATQRRVMYGQES